MLIAAGAGSGLGRLAVLGGGIVTMPGRPGIKAGGDEG
jgi:hypothetical protein